MGRINISFHPLFFLFGIYYAFIGKIFVFLIYAVTAAIHEIGHAIVGEKLGYRLNKITLMPFGAIATGNIDGLKATDEIKVALAGPTLNLAIALFFIALWWISPEWYAFTDTAAEANLTMALINFIPAYPLDGGRVLSAMLENKLGKKKAYCVCKAGGIIFSIILFSAFIWTVFNVINYSVLFFALFVFFGAISREKENVYVSIFEVLNENRLLRGTEIKTIAIDEKATVKKLVTLLDTSKINEVIVYKNGEPKEKLGQKRITEIIEKGNLYAPLKNFI